MKKGMKMVMAEREEGGMKEEKKKRETEENKREIKLRVGRAASDHVTQGKGSQQQTGGTQPYCIVTPRGCK